MTSRHKKKKIPLSTGEEVDIDMNDMEPDSPVLWLRIDPDMEVIRIAELEQPDYMWQYMLRHERCVVAQSQVRDANREIQILVYFKIILSTYNI